MKIGIPRAFLYFKYHHLWETFFEELGVEYIVSPETNKEIMKLGMSYAIDESCLSSKIYLGHVAYLLDKCDYIFIPRVSSFGVRDIVCSKFQAIYDVVKNTFRDQNPKILYYNIDFINKDTEMKAFLKMGKFLGKKKVDIVRAYYVAKQAEKIYYLMNLKEQRQLLQQKDLLKILIVAHPYNIYDKYIGEPILETLKSLGCVPINADLADKKEAMHRSKEITKTLPWTFNKELVGALAIYKDQVDGIILMSSFPCGPDSLVNDMILRRVKDKPILNLILDGQEGNAGIETRLESFVDIIKIKEESRREKA